MLLVLIALLLAVGIAAFLWLGSRLVDRLDTIDSRVTDLGAKADEATDTSEDALNRAQRAEEAARAAAAGRLLAEADAERATTEADASREDAARARAEADRIRAEAENELNRLENALGKVAETRRTALGVVMHLGEESIKFDFDKADLKPKDRELLSRIAGILLTSDDYTITVNGHTDNVGTTDYNQALSERRAQAVRDYLAESGIEPLIMTVEGMGQTQPLVQGTSEQARARNRRVELGIVNTRIRYPSARRD